MLINKLKESEEEREGRSFCCRFAKLFKQTWNNFALQYPGQQKRQANGKGGTSAL